MTLVSDTHGAHGAVYRDRGGRRVVDHYRKPERVGKAVRNVVGAIEMGYGVLAITGEDRVEFIDNAVSNRIPEADGQGVYALLLDPQGGIETDMYVYNADERLLVFFPPERTEAVAEDWASKVFIQDVTIDDISDELGVSESTAPSRRPRSRLASVGGPGAPEKPLSFVRGSMVDAGVTVIASDAPLGEEGYEVVCAAEDAEEVLDTLLNRGLNAAPFGYGRGTRSRSKPARPSSSTSLKERCRTSSDSATPWTSRRGVTSVRRSSPALRIRDGRAGVSSDSTSTGLPTRPPTSTATPTRRGTTILPSPGAAVFDGDEAVGEVTRAAVGPAAGDPIALAFARFDADLVDPTVRVDGEEVAATRSDLPFPSVDGSAQSAAAADVSERDE